jgi:hypothetical protein
MAQSKKRQKQGPAPKTSQQKKIFVGAGIIAVLIGVIVFARYWQQSAKTGTIVGAYTKGAENAPIVMKEFSDYQ